MKIGDRIRPVIDESIRVYDKLLLILTEQSIKSAWVEKEVETAFEKEQQHQTVLFPIRLDDAVMDATEAWAADIRPASRATSETSAAGRTTTATAQPSSDCCGI